MILVRQTLDGPINRVDETIERIKEHEPRNGYAVKNSFGKDSGVVMKLMEMAEVTFDAHHNFTTVDPPQLIRHGLKNYPDTEIHRPDITHVMRKVHPGLKVRIRSMWDLIVYKGFPPSVNVGIVVRNLKNAGFGTGSVFSGSVRRNLPLDRVSLSWKNAGAINGSISLIRSLIGRRKMFGNSQYGIMYLIVNCTIRVSTGWAVSYARWLRRNIGNLKQHFFPSIMLHTLGRLIAC